MHKSFIALLVFIFFSTSYANAQQELTWFDFADVTFDLKYNEEFGAQFLTPTFGGRIQSFRGKEIQITGYYLDVAGNGEINLVSQNPMASCFFCGASGPETIIEVNFKEKPSFKTDDIIVVSGILDLNTDNVNNCNYILNEATAVPLN